MEVITSKDQRLSKYFDGRIYIEEGVWIVFERVLDYNNTNCDAITCKFVVSSTETTTLLGTYFNNYWHSPCTNNADLMWKHIKNNKSKVMRIIKSLKVPVGEFAPFVLEWKCLRRRFTLKSLKVRRQLIKSIH